MAGEPFDPQTYHQEFAKRRAVRVIRRAQAGIIYSHSEGTVDEWIFEAIGRGILPADWQKWNEVQR